MYFSNRLGCVRPLIRAAQSLLTNSEAAVDELLARSGACTRRPSAEERSDARPHKLARKERALSELLGVLERAGSASCCPQVPTIDRARRL
jgi:hypothetical protein